MADERITIEDLNPTVLPSRDQVVPAMEDGITVKLSIAQILSLVEIGDVAGLTGALNLKADILQPQTSVASATTVDLGAIAASNILISGTTSITSFGTAPAGTFKFVRFAGSLTLTHNAASLILPNGGANIVTSTNDACRALSLGSGNWAVIGYQRASGIGVIGSRGRTIGLTLANDTGGDVTNDIIIAAGSAPSDTSPYNVMTLASSLTKRTDAAWAVGTGNGGWLDGASMPDGWGYAFILGRSDAGVTDVGFSASSSAPPLPSNYDRKQLIGAIFRTGGAIKLFVQYPNRDVVWVTPAVDFNSGTLSTAGALVTLTVPPISGTEAHIGALLNDATGDSIWIRETAQTNDAITTSNTDLSVTTSSQRSHSDMTRFVDGSAQIRYRSVTASATLFRIETRGFRLPG